MKTPNLIVAVSFFIGNRDRTFQASWEEENSPVAKTIAGVCFPTVMFSAARRNDLFNPDGSFYEGETDKIDRAEIVALIDRLVKAYKPEFSRSRSATLERTATVVVMGPSDRLLLAISEETQPEAYAIAREISAVIADGCTGQQRVHSACGEHFTVAPEPSEG